MNKNMFDSSWDRTKKITGWKKKTELANFLEINTSSVSGAKKRDSFPLEWAYKIAKTYDTSTDWILDGRGPKRPGQPDQGKVYHPGDYGYVPMAEAQLSAGDGAFVTTENIRDYYAFRTDWLCRTATSVKNAILMSVIGNSMEPTIHEGDIVMLDTGRTHIYDGKIYALRMEDTIMIKRLSLRPGDRIQVISDNKTEYAPYESRRDDIHVLAQVVWFARALVRPE